MLTHRRFLKFLIKVFFISMNGEKEVDYEEKDFISSFNFGSCD